MVFRFYFIFSSGALIYIPWDLTFFFVIIVDGLSCVVTNKAHTKSGPGKNVLLPGQLAGRSKKKKKSSQLEKAQEQMKKRRYPTCM
jgi:hypothetical protein